MAARRLREKTPNSQHNNFLEVKAVRQKFLIYIFIGGKKLKGGRPRNTDSIIDAILREGRKKRDGYRKIDLLAKLLWEKALPAGHVGDMDLDKIDLKAVRFILEYMEGKPVEKKNVTVDIFSHFPKMENKELADTYKVYEIEKKDIAIQ